MDQPLLLGIDVGTQGVKGALVQASGKVLTQAFVEHESHYPRPDWVEHDMQKNWWLDSISVIRQVLKDGVVHPERIKAIGVSGLYPALGPTDKDGNPLRGAILYSDNRAVVEVEEVNRRFGLLLSSEELTPKLIWYLRNESELAVQTRMFFDAAHYLIFKLTGAYVTDTITTGLYGAIFEAPTASWRPEVCDQLGIPLWMLPSVHPPATVVGTVLQSAADRTGLIEGTPVIAGMPDLYASMISAGIVHMHESIAYYGTGGVLPVMKDGALNAARKPFPISEKGGKVQEGYLYDYPVYCLSVGDAVHWFRENFAPVEIALEREPGRISAYAQLDSLAAEVPPGSEGLLFMPYFQGQRSPEFNPWANGVFFGLRGVHGRGHVFRAILESWGYSIRYGLESFYPQGHPIKRLVATGGGARSPLWRQIVSDITGMAQEYVPEADGPLGAAYIAGLAVGIFDDFEVLQTDWVQVSAITCPDPDTQRIYDRYYPVFVELHDSLRSIYQHHHAIQSSTGA